MSLSRVGLNQLEELIGGDLDDSQVCPPGCGEKAPPARIDRRREHPS